MIRFANYEDIPKIMQFIDKHWKKDHIMSRNRELFEFQHIWGNEVSFVLSENNQGELDGILGYIPYDLKDRDVMLAIWKTIKTDNTMLGIDILRFLREDSTVKTLSAPGINPKTRSIYQFLGIPTGKMRHWYRLNQRDKYKIAIIDDFEVPWACDDKDVSIEEYFEFEKVRTEFEKLDYRRQENRPYKSADYIERRYFSHPVFHYLKYGIRCAGEWLMLIFRVQPYKGSGALRLIDGIGDLELFPYFTKTMDRLMEQLDCEYADIYETGMNERLLVSGGWKRKETTGNIIPEYFSPFEQRNVDIYYMSEIPNAVLFKGDGDMDRPN